MPSSLRRQGGWVPRYASPKRFTLTPLMLLPSKGGNTRWADMVGAYDALDAAWKTRLAPLRAIHNLDFSRNRRHGEDPMTEEQKREVPPVDHPIIRTHPDTGRQCIFLGDHAQSIVGMGYEEGRALIEEVNVMAITPELVYEHKWQPRDLMIWDNRSTLHRALPYDEARERRVIRRCTVIGDVPRQSDLAWQELRTRTLLKPQKWNAEEVR
jgi:alpha-ketoglutarate-dependent taurine dioxygenase